MSRDREPPLREPAPAVPVPGEHELREPAYVEQSREDTDAGWGEYPAPDGDDRLLADRPPHWDNF